MFSVKMPEAVAKAGGAEAGLLSQTMAQWKTFWMFPAIMAAVIAAVFFLAFWDKTRVGDEE